MSLQALATTLLLPPIGLLLAALVLLIWRGRLARLLVLLAVALHLLLATPFVAGWATTLSRRPPGPETQREHHEQRPPDFRRRHLQ